MTLSHEATVAGRFDALQSRFKAAVAADDVRLVAVLRALRPVDGGRVLDLGCGKGRFAQRLQGEGFDVVGLDLSAAMLAAAGDLPRVRGSARRLPFASGSFDGVIAIEMFEHLHPDSIGAVLAEVRRVLRPGGIVAIVDKNAAALDARRPWLPAVAVKRLDERRGRWMYRPGEPARERWPWPRAFRSRLREYFDDVKIEHLLISNETRWAVFRRVPAARLLALWSAKAPGGFHG
ncbi:MAG TPA: class I SAM-dependent methyltransferase [Isosphaeraceae bacterium]|nr:class I SAM-dependent methyltransferase [Isosphaeraceae bacterium]